MSADTGGVAFLDYGGLGAAWVARTGGPVTTFRAGNPIGVATDGTYLYWAERYGGEIYRGPVAGGTAERIGTVPNEPSSIAVAGDDLYVGIQPSGPAHEHEDVLFHLPRTGGAATSMYSVKPGEGHRIWSVAADDSWVYWTEDSLVARMPRGGGTPTVLVSGNGQWLFVSLGLGDTELVVGSEGGIYRLPRAGGALQNLFGIPSYEDFIGGIAADGDGVYFITRSAVRFVARDGEEVRDLARPETTPAAVAVDASGLYFSTYWHVPQPDGGHARLDAGTSGKPLQPGEIPGGLWRIPR